MAEYINYQYPKKSGKRKFIVIAVIFIVVLSVGLGFLAARNDSKGPGSKPADNNAFISALIKNDAQASYALMTDGLKGRVGSSTDWADALAVSFGKDNASFKVDGTSSVQNPEAAYGKDSFPQRVNYTVTFNDGKTYKMYIILIKTGDSYKVDEYDSSRQ